MFLKRIEINGFKSFADKTVISFDNPITGIVGPNGCGKSNITDAIRWVLGEQSISSLRGDKTMSSVIFNGSTNRRTVGSAEVSLIFDNNDKIFNTEFDEVQITRRITKKDNESEFYINGEQVRLKDVLDLTMDSGLAKDSLNIISQGQIAAFADAKPDDRRSFFEEAAGVSKYKKKKNEALNKLTRTQDNLDRASDIINELEQQVVPLANKAKKAKKYQEYKERLDAIEIKVLTDEITFLNGKVTESKKSQFDLETEQSIHNTTIAVNETSINEKKTEISKLDVEIQSLQNEFVKTVNEVGSLEKTQTEVEQKRKYALETGNKEEKASELTKALNEAKYEYETRQKAFDDLGADIALMEKEQADVILKKIDTDQDYSSITSKYKSLLNRKDVLENLMRRPFSQQQGVQAVMDAINSLPGVLGVIATELHPVEGYEEAISTALGGSLYNIVTKDSDSAREAINFLKRNQSGRATFLPKSVLKEHFILEEDEIIASNQEGYLGIACDFVDNEETYDIVRDSLLGNIVIVDKLYNANNIADLLKYRYNVVTLDGEIVHRGGSMTGGKAKDDVSYMTLHKEYLSIDNQIAKQYEEVQKIGDKKDKVEADKEKIDAKLWEARVNYAKAEPLVEVKKAKYNQIVAEIQSLGLNTEISDERFDNDLIVKINELSKRKSEIETQLQLKRDNRFSLNNECERKEQQLKQYRRELQEINDKLQSVNIDLARLDVLLTQNIERLNTAYHLTYEFALTKVKDEVIENGKEEVEILRKKIENLGSVDLDAPAEYEEKNKRYEELSKNFAELTESRDKLLKTIEEMDEQMKDQFITMFDQINYQFNVVFQELFNGGKARLYLEDENDILNSGVEIEAHPPGKVIHTNKQLSGGEKTLVAFCVLFAILRCRTIPLCIFDEVDTALDPANNDRFANYIKRVSNNSQFLVVTHHPSTMVKCDVLYGVTMANDGVSSILKVQLDEASKLVEN